MDSIPTLHDEFKYTGLWWLPDQKETKWAGTLSFKPEEGARLDLLLIDEDAERGHPLNNDLQRIVGIAPTDKNELSVGNVFTLLNCQSRGYRVQPGITNYRFHAQYALRGFLWYSLTEEINFKSTSVDFSSLAGWMPPVTSITSEFEEDDSNKSLTRVDATYHSTPPIEIQLSTIQSSLSFTTWLQSSTGSREIHWRQSHSVRIEPNRTRSLQWYINQIYRIRDLFSFLTGLPVEPKYFDATVSSNQIDNFEIDQKIHIYHSVRQPKTDEEFNYRMPFPLHRLDSQVQTVFNTWLELNEDQLVPYILCLDVINNAHQFWQFEFLALVQALESHHRLNYEKVGRKQGKYKNEKGEIKKNGPDFIDRLQELRELFPKQLSQGPELDDDFLKRVVRTRNYYTHYSSRHREQAFQGIDLYRANTRFIPFVAYFLYRELGISEEIVHEGFEATRYRGLWKPRLQDDN